MSNPYIGEIRMFGGTFAPAGWAFCDIATPQIAVDSEINQCTISKPAFAIEP